VTESTSIGPVGYQVIANIERLRKDRRLSFEALSGLLAEVGRPIGPTVLNRQSHGGRRVDADDLVAFAAVLGTTPAGLLAPPGAAVAEDHPAVLAARSLADRLAALITAGDPEAAARARGQVDRAMRRVQLEVEELLEA
jgi:hypothetical protein